MIISAVGILKFQNQILFLKRTEFDRTLPNVLCLPGGKIEKDEEILLGLHREIYEETKINTKNIKSEFMGAENFTSPNGKIFEINFYLFEINEILNVQISEEHDSYSWIALEDIEKSNIGQVTKNFLQKIDKKLKNAIYDSSI